MQNFTRRIPGRRLRAPGPWRSFILLLVLAIAASGLQLASGGHAGGAAMSAHDLASMSDGSSDGEPCCHETDGQAHELICSTAAGCSICVPVILALLHVRPDADRAEAGPTGSLSGLIQPPQVRPPKLMVTV